MAVGYWVDYTHTECSDITVMLRYDLHVAYTARSEKSVKIYARGRLSEGDRISTRAVKSSTVRRHDH